MELSQTSLAAMMLAAIPIGVFLNVVYLLTGTRTNNDSTIKKMLLHIKDFLFLIIAALITVILVYYLNDGDYRYLAPVGVLLGYLMNDFLLRRWIIGVRDYVLRVFGKIILVPCKWIWRTTLTPILKKSEEKRMVTQTNHRIKELMYDASNGFENNTEAKA